MFSRENYIETGKILKPYKANGSLKVSSYFDLSGLPPTGDFIFIEIDKKPVPFYIEQVDIMEERVLVLKLEDVDTRDEALSLVSKLILMPKTNLDPNHEAFYISDITDYSVLDSNSGIRAHVTALIESSGQNVLEIQAGKKVYLIPFHEDFIQKTDHEQKLITMKLPDGLLHN